MGRGIPYDKLGAYRLYWGLLEARVVPGEGLEPSRCRHRRILSPLRLPFRHPGRDAASHGGARGAGRDRRTRHYRR